MEYNVSYHYFSSRQEREALIEKYVGTGDIIETFEVFREQKGRREVHYVTNTGVIIVYSPEDNKIMTKYVARPQQLRRLYGLRGEEPPKWLLRLAYEHNRKRYNDI